MSVARAFEGLREIPGPLSNPVILHWAREIGAPEGYYTNDDLAWCALFMNRLALACQFPLSGSGYELLRARSFTSWGQALAEPALGAWLVFVRPEGGHVGLYLGERADAYRVLGGNTSNQVGAAWIAKSRLIAARWPIGVPWPTSPHAVLLADTGTAPSTNEA